MELKVLVLGRRSVTRRISNALIEGEVSIMLQYDIDDAITLLKKEKFDLTLVDGCMDNLESICYRITWQCRVPVVLIVNSKETDWNLLKTMDIDGFIPEEAGNAEILAYFNSIVRRKDCRPAAAKILVIEDDPQTVEALRIAFQMYWPEAKLKCVLTGTEGLLYTRLDPANVVLLDLKLPDISGFEVLGKIRSISQVPVIIVTATRTPEFVVKAMNLGANDYIVKPFKQLNLMSRIRQHLTFGAAVSRV
jgi:DNA-binding response OmpR family regulator